MTIHAMLFVKDKAKLWGMCHRALKQGGKLYVEDWLVDNRVTLEPEEQLFLDEKLHI